MPEGPEIRHMASAASAVCNSRVLASGFGHLVGQKLGLPQTHGKWIWIPAGDKNGIAVKCNLNGRLFVLADGEATPTFHVTTRKGTIAFEGSGGGRIFAATPADWAAIREDLGPDPLHETITPEYLTSAAKRRRACLAEALIDQKLIAGIGNYLRAEIIAAAGFPPAVWMKPIRDLSPSQVALLADTINRIMREALDGTLVLRAYRQPGVKFTTLKGRKFYHL